MNNPAHQVSVNIVWLFVALVALFCAWETFAPGRPLLLPTHRRWLSHLALYFGSLLPLHLLGVGPVALALARTHASHGLLSQPDVPWPVTFLATFLVMDLTRYAVHRLTHSVSFLWRIHLLHHSDRDFDFTNDLRFHPLDAALHLSAALLVVWILVPPPVAVALSEALALAIGMFVHANVNFSATLERHLRWFIITPGLHQIHHSIDEPEQGRNLGVVFVWWDRFFGTFMESPACGYAQLQFGVREVDVAECVSPSHMIFAPFRDYTVRAPESPASTPSERNVTAPQPEPQLEME